MQPIVTKEDELHVVVWKYEVLAVHLNQFRLAFDEGGEVSVFLRSRKGLKGLRLFAFDHPSRLYFLINIWENKRSYEEFKLSDGNKFELICKKYAYLFKSVDNVFLEQYVL